ncbi:MAG TPA: hypothetical protein VE077_07040 [Candidatus Methylomirabilis sp.]|nr:hypothetical protein [Candidatus Methylomirabilis sp.]
MHSEKTSNAQSAVENVSSAGGVLTIVQDCGCVAGAPSDEQRKWCERAAALLGAQAADAAALRSLLELIFHYDAGQVLARVESHVVLSRSAARDVVRQVALFLLDGAPLTTERFSEMVRALKEGLQVRGRELFHPLRLALAGRAGEGELDRVILLLDEASGLGFATPVKSARERILEFCAALD